MKKRQVNVSLDERLFLAGKKKAQSNYMKFAAYVSKLIVEDLNKDKEVK